MEKKRLTNTISAVLIAKNEEKNLPRCLGALDFCQEIVVVVDKSSTDNTAMVAKKRGTKVFFQRFQGFGRQKNYGIAKAKGDWILSLDADEVITPPLKKAIVRAVGQREIDGFLILRRAWFLGKPIKHSGWFPEYKLRLVKKPLARFEKRLVHEDMIAVRKMKKLKGILEHYSYPTLIDYWQKMAHYTTLQARQTPFNFLFLLGKPWYRFFKMYFVQLGFLDGWRGFILAKLSGLYELLVQLKALKGKYVKSRH